MSSELSTCASEKWIFLNLWHESCSGELFSVCDLAQPFNKHELGLSWTVLIWMGNVPVFSSLLAEFLINLWYCCYLESSPTSTIFRGLNHLSLSQCVLMTVLNVGSMSHTRKGHCLCEAVWHRLWSSLAQYPAPTLSLAQNFQISSRP